MLRKFLIKVMENHANRPEVYGALTSGSGASTRLSTTLGENMMYAAVPIHDGGAILGVARVALPLAEVQSNVNQVIFVIIIGMGVITVLVVLAAWLIARVTTRPIRELTRASRIIAAGEFSHRIATGTRDESGQLARAFNDMAGQINQMVTTITEDKTRLATILDNMADGIVMTDSEGSVRLVNRAAERLLGVSRQNMDARPLIETARDYELTDILKQCLEDAKLHEIQFESSASTRFLRAIAMTVTGDRADGALILLQDLTELRGLQTTRRELIGNISHDFRTPLAGIKAMVETLRGGAIDEAETARDFLSRIEAEVDRLTQMVAELTELSRIETGRTQLNLAPVDLNALVEEVAAQLRPLAERQNLSLTTELAAGLPEVPADRERLRQVIVNLMHNAVKFNRPGGSIKAATRLTEGAVTVEISDTGIGIPRSDLNRIFERFYKSDRSRSGQGAGMGLAIARHVVEAHGLRSLHIYEEGEEWMHIRDAVNFSLVLPYSEGLENVVFYSEEKKIEGNISLKKGPAIWLWLISVFMLVGGFWIWAHIRKRR